ncbi:MAG: hypothetical protein ACO265_08430 [Polynucleobacter sp.]
MKVKIGPYLKWWGPYQIAELLLGFPEGRYDYITGKPLDWRTKYAERLGDWLADSWVGRFCDWVYSKRKRNVYVHIDGYDVWNMDETLRHIIAPMFVKLKATKHGYGFIEDADVPEHLHSTKAEVPRGDHGWDSNAEARYTWLVDELIWVFSTDHEEAKHQFYDWSQVDKAEGLAAQISNLQVDHAGLQAYEARVQRAYELFGKYYQTFWD